MGEKGVDYKLEAANPFDPPDWFRDMGLEEDARRYPER